MLWNEVEFGEEITCVHDDPYYLESLVLVICLSLIICN